MKQYNKEIEKQCDKDKGYFLIEAMVAIGVITVGLLAAMGLISRSVGLNRVIGDQFTANYLAAEGIEVTKNIIDTNFIRKNPWNSGFSNGDFEVDYKSTSLLNNADRSILYDPTTGFYGYQSGNQTLFKRTIKIQLIGSDEIKVNSIVNWKSTGDTQFSINLEDHFFNWRP